MFRRPAARGNGVRTRSSHTRRPARGRSPYPVERLESRRLLTAALSFSPSTAFVGAGPQVNDLAVGNFNGDAFPDLIVAPYVGNGSDPGEIKVLINNGGNGTFTQTDLKGIEKLGARLVVGDFNNDGKSDVATIMFGDLNHIAVLLGNGNGTLQAPVSITVTPTIDHPGINGMSAADFNNDGKLDFVVSGETMPLVVMLGNGAGGILGRITITPGGQSSVSTGDVNGDGKVDILVKPHASNGTEIHRGLGTGNFANPDLLLSAGAANKFLVDDFNEDGKADLAIAEEDNPDDFNQGVNMYAGDGNGNFTFVFRYNPGYAAYNLLPADFDGDFHKDLAMAIATSGYPDNVAIIYTGRGNGHLNPSVKIPIPGLFTFAMVAGDFNLDGKTDLIAVDGAPFPDNLVLLTNTSIFQNLITGRVYRDYNANGSQDAVESNLAGRNVYDDANDNGIRDAGEAVTVTGADGTYQLLVAPGTHRIRQELPPDWFQTTPGTPAAGKTTAQIVTVGQYQIVAGRNFGATQLAVLSGRTYYDLNDNGRSDDSDPGDGPFKVFIDYDFDGVRDANEPSMFSDGFTGRYAFTGLYPGNYSVRVEKPTGWYQTAPVAAGPGGTGGPNNTFAYGGFDTTYTDFGLIYPAFVSGKVFDDKNADGNQANTGEPGLPQWYVYVDVNGNGYSDLSEPFVQTDAAGNYRLRSPVYGTYQVKVLRPSGWQSTVPASGARTVTMVNGSEITNQNFGMTQGALNNAGFRPPLNLASGTGGFSNPISVATGDFNRDGKADFVSANNASDLTVYLNDGVGGFAAASAGYAGSSVRQVIAADLNDDGKLDLVTANQDDNNISVLLGVGNGTFQPHVDYAAAAGANGVVTGDFNMDGKVDIAVAGKYTDQLALLKGNGNGTFAAATNIANVYGAVALAAGDVNGDTKLDLVSANDSSGNVTVLLGGGNGTFQLATTLTVGIVNPVSIVLAYLNGDNVLDLAVVNRFSDNVRVKFGVNAGGFATGIDYGVGSTPAQVAAGDIDGDGKVDLVVACESDGTTAISGGVNVLRNTGNGAFDPPLTSTAHTSPKGVALADFNGDGLLDLAAANFYSDDVSVMLNDRTAPTASLAGIVFADDDGNGIKGAAENGIAGRTVFLDADNDGALDPGEVIAATDAAGNFLFPPLTPGSYIVRQIVTDGWSQTAPAAGAGQAITLVVGQVATLQFGLRDTKAPAVFEAALAPANGPMNFRVVFDEDLGTTLTAADLVVTNLDIGQPVAAEAALVKTLSGGFLTATFNFPSGGVADGNYRALLPASAVTDAAGNPLAADLVLDFFVLAGDANHDRAVDFNDLVPLAQHYGAAGTFAEGDYNYDGIVGFNDLVILAQRYNKSLPLPTLSAPATVVSALAAGAPTTRAARDRSAKQSVFSTAPMTRPMPPKPKLTARSRRR